MWRPIFWLHIVLVVVTLAYLTLKDRGVQIEWDLLPPVPAVLLELPWSPATGNWSTPMRVVAATALTAALVFWLRNRGRSKE